MTALEEIKKALDGVTPVTWSYQFTEENGEVFIIANELGGMIGAALPWPTEVDEKDFRRVVAYAKYIATANPAAISELISTLESLQRENEELREHQLVWRSMDSAPKDGKHCILSIPTGGGFVYSVQGAFLNGKWMNALDVDVEPLAWMPNALLPDELCPWLESARSALASTGGEHHAE